MGLRWLAFSIACAIGVFAAMFGFRWAILALDRAMRIAFPEIID